MDRYVATLVGTLNPASQATTYYFQYGTTTAYGLQTSPVTIAAGSTPLTVTATAPGLQSGTVFHYRLVATHGSTSGTTYPVTATTTSTVIGTDLTFQTLPWPRPASSIAFTVAPLTPRRAPVTFHMLGRVGLAYTITPALGCNGTVIVRVYQGLRQLAVSQRRSVRLRIPHDRPRHPVCAAPVRCGSPPRRASRATPGRRPALSSECS